MARASEPIAPDACMIKFYFLPFCCNVKFHVHFHPHLHLPGVPAQQDLLLSLASFGKEKSAVSTVLESFGNMHSGVQEQPKNKGMYCTGSGIREGRYPSRRGSFCIFSHISSCIPLRLFSLVAQFVFYFPDTNGVSQQAAVTASHLQVNEASVREGRDLASLL